MISVTAWEWIGLFIGMVIGGLAEAWGISNPEVLIRLADILPLLKHVGFLLFLMIRLHPSRSGRFCRNQLLSFKVDAGYGVASLGISVFPLHASLSTCNWNMPFACTMLYRGTEAFPTCYTSPYGSMMYSGFTGITCLKVV